MVERTAEYRECGELEIIFVDVDNASEQARIKSILKEYGVEFPVLFYGKKMDSPPVREWKISGVPRAFLINPQGVIVAHPLPRDNTGLIDLFEILRTQPDETVSLGLRTSRIVEDDSQVELILELYSPQRRPLHVEVNVTLPLFEWDFEKEILLKAERYQPDKENPEYLLDVEFDGTCEQVVVLEIDTEGYSGLEFSVKVLIPGSEALNDGSGMWNFIRGEEYFRTGNASLDEYLTSHSIERF